MKIKIKSWNKKLLEPYIKKAKKKCIEDIIGGELIEYLCDGGEWCANWNVYHLEDRFKFENDTVEIPYKIAEGKFFFCKHSASMSIADIRKEAIIKKLIKKGMEVEDLDENNT